MKILDITVNKERLYNPELKLWYLESQIKNEGFRRAIYFDFLNSAVVEKQLDKDLFAFNDREVSDLIRSLGLSSEIGIRRVLSVYKEYVDWCISNGHRGEYESRINYVEAVQRKANVKQYISNRKIRNSILTKSEVEDLMNILVNPSDQALVYCFYSLIGGKGAYEIRSLRKEDIDIENKIIKLTANEEGDTRIHHADTKLIKLLLEAANQKEYILNNGNLIGKANTPSIRQFLGDKYIFRQTDSGKVDDETGIIPYNTITQKFQALKRYTGYDFITPGALRNSRLVSEVTNMTREAGLYVADDFIYNELNRKLNNKYNFKLSPMQLYNLKDLYENAIEVKQFDL